MSITDITLRQLRLAAAEADLDVRTVAKVVIGEPTRPLCRERAVEALNRLGVDWSPPKHTKKGTRK